MKKIYIALTILTVLFGISHPVKSQSAKQYVLFEHFTNASCVPCAQQNPVFQGNILTKNVGNIHHIAYHSWWPGNNDPFYQYNIQENTDRINYYGVNAVPDMYMRGNHWNGGPAAVTQNLINEDQKSGSPIRVKVSETVSGADHNVTVEVQSVGTPPTGNYVLMVAVVESDVTFATPPGTNGETYFPNVFRKFLTGSSGNPISFASQGSSTSASFTYQMDPVWDSTKIYLVAFVQNTATKEVVNSGSTRDPAWEFFNTSATTFQAGQPSQSNHFTADFEMLGNSENIVIRFTAEQPVNWTASCTINGFPVNDSLVFPAGTGSSNPVQVTVTPGSDAGIGTYTVSVYSLNNPQYSPQTVVYYVISGVTDLIVTNDAAFGDGSTNFDWTPLYEAGLSYAGNTSFAATRHPVFLEAMNNNMLTGVNHIYYNVGWSFPGLTDEKVAALEQFLDNGGNLLIAGQDIGWETWDPNGYGTAATRSFYTNYMQAQYFNDGNSANNLLTPVNTDNVFGFMNSSQILPVYSNGQNDYMYPDVIGPAATGSGKAIFNYNNNQNKVAGIRADNGTYKIVYLGIGIEMIGDSTVRNEFMKLTHDWFHGLIVGTNFDLGLERLAVTLSPVPARDHLTVHINQPGKQLVVTDLSGRTVWSENCQNRTGTLEIPVKDWPAGMYQLTLQLDNGSFITRKLMIQ